MAGAQITIMLGGDVMTGRGIDQILPHPSEPILYESLVRSAVDYVRLAEQANGPIARPVPFPYIWGDLIPALQRHRPDLRIINLETAVTRANDPWPKGINYRMTPENLPVIKALGVDCCTLANNHVLDWGRDGLLDTLAALDRSAIRAAGAGRNAEAATAPAVLPVPGKGRVLFYAGACASSGVPVDWTADSDRPGVNVIGSINKETIEPIAARIRRDKRPGDVCIFSIHWGPNWGYEIAEEDRALAHELIAAGVDIVHGHSAHHAKAIEVHRGRPILYGCGDLINDYEGIENHEPYRDDHVLAYLATIDIAEGRLTGLEMLPFRIRKFRLDRASAAEADWLRATMDRECRRFGRGVKLKNGTLRLEV